MANYYASASGNFHSSSIWATYSSGSGGAGVPSVGDIAYSNGKTVAITANVTCAKISSETESGSIVGGGFTLGAGVVLTANLYGGASGNLLTVSYNSPGSSSIIGNAVAALGNSNHAIYVNGTGTLNISGSVTGGNLPGYNNCFGVNILAAATINVVGDVNYPNGIVMNASVPMIVNVTGNVRSLAALASTSTLNITGNVYGSDTFTQGYGMNLTATSASVNINGNVYAGNGYQAHGINFNSTGATLTVTGNVYGGDGGSTSGYGIYHSNTGTVIVVGSATGGRYVSGIYNNNLGTLRVTRAIGNSFGLGQSVGVTTSVGVYSAIYNSPVYVEEIQYGTAGGSPTAGPIRLTPKTTNVALFTKSDSTQKTLYDATNLAGALPAASDVRYGTVYNYSANTGTCYVPNSGSVAKGVPVDNTTGVAVLTQDAIWGTLASALSVSGSIGERLKNVSTVASTGAQLAAALSV